MLILDDLHLDNDMDLPPHAVQGIKDGEPTVQGVLRATVGKGVETDVHLANGIVGSVCVIVH